MRGIVELGGEVKLPGTSFSLIIKLVVSLLIGIPWTVLILGWAAATSGEAQLVIISGALGLALLAGSRVEQYYCHAVLAISFRKFVTHVILEDEEAMRTWAQALCTVLELDDEEALVPAKESVEDEEEESEDEPIGR
jgi:hypothetical protein